jgi:DNA (cytosine-5)-methyltransferase 1
MPQYIINRLEGKYRQKTAIKPSSAEVIGNTCLAHYAGDQSTQMVLREDGEITPYSVREYANMQGFPPGFKLIDRKKTYRGIGNAVSVPVAKAVADALMPLL